MMPVLFSSLAYDYLAKALASKGGYETGRLERRAFPDGETYHRIETPVRDRDVVLVGGTVSDADTLELYDLATGLILEKARSLVLVMPYFGYSTMERAVHAGEVVKAKSRARLFSSLPRATNGNTVLLLDVHSEGLPYYFEEPVRALHVYAKRVLRDAILEVKEEDLVLASTDAGRAKWVESLANEIGVPPAFVFKRRIDGRHTAITGVSADVKGKPVVIYDDMIRTGGSLLQAAQAYRDAGARSIVAATTHGVFPGDSFKTLKGSGLFQAIYCTDSHPRALALNDPFLRVRSVAPLFDDFIKKGTL